MIKCTLTCPCLGVTLLVTGKCICLLSLGSTLSLRCGVLESLCSLTENTHGTLTQYSSFRLLFPSSMGKIRVNLRYAAAGVTKLLNREVAGSREKGGLEEWWNPWRQKVYDFPYCEASTGECTDGSVCLGLCLPGTPSTGMLLCSVCTPGACSLCLSRPGFSLSFEFGQMCAQG